MWLQCVCVVCWGCLSLLSGGTEDELMSSILTSPSPGDHDDYWHALYRLVLKGRLSEARDLLSHHPITHLMPQVTQLLQGERSVLPKNSGFTLMFILVELCVWFVELKKLKLSTPPTHTHPHTQVHASMDELLRKAPMILSTGSYSRAELQRRWNEWRGEVVRRRGAGEFTAHAELELLAAVSVKCVWRVWCVCEDLDVFNSIAHLYIVISDLEWRWWSVWKLYVSIYTHLITIVTLDVSISVAS